MKRFLQLFIGAVALAAGASLFAQATPEIAYDANADVLQLPSGTYFGEVAGVATNSRGHVFVYTRTGHAVAGARVDEDMTFRVRRDARDFAVRRQRKHVGVRVVGDLGHRLGEERRAGGAGRRAHDHRT